MGWERRGQRIVGSKVGTEDAGGTRQEGPGEHLGSLSGRVNHTGLGRGWVRGGERPEQVPAIKKKATEGTGLDRQAMSEYRWDLNK